MVKALFKNINFLMKFIAMVLMLTAYLVFATVGHNADAVPGKCIDDPSVEGRLQKDDFAPKAIFFVCLGYAPILTVFVLLYFLGEVPDKWAQRLFLLTGATGMLLIGCWGIITTSGAAPDVINSLLCFTSGVLLAVDWVNMDFFSGSPPEGSEPTGNI